MTGCAGSSTFSSLVFGLYSAKPIHANPTIPPTTAITCISIIHNATLLTSNTVPTKPARIACLCCVVFVDGLSFLSVASPSKHTTKEELSVAFGLSIEEFWAFLVFSNVS
ncbi:MAG: hypothetical protein O7160_06025 [Wolbachia endosymbiont of Andrena labialis]|nr:hypothetical protein [Wolbachia endosymbiont of Andrena labialis]